MKSVMQDFYPPLEGHAAPRQHQNLILILLEIVPNSLLKSPYLLINANMKLP
jgi:hypothetical protein